MKRRIGLFGGTFNPIHYGHISLALELKEKKDLDQVWFIPSNHSPLRMQEPQVLPHHRLKMLALALSDVPDCLPLDLELQRPAPSYTIDTIREILKMYPHEGFSFLCGEDSLMRFQEWKEPLEIIRLLPLLIGSRPQSRLLQELPPEIATAIREGLVSTRQMEISATDIRERIKKRLYCKHLLPGKTLDYIYENQLYCSSLTV